MLCACNRSKILFKWQLLQPRNCTTTNYQSNWINWPMLDSNFLCFFCNCHTKYVSDHRRQVNLNLLNNHDYKLMILTWTWLPTFFFVIRVQSFCILIHRFTRKTLHSIAVRVECARDELCTCHRHKIPTPNAECMPSWIRCRRRQISYRISTEYIKFVTFSPYSYCLIS